MCRFQFDYAGRLLRQERDRFGRRPVCRVQAHAKIGVASITRRDLEA